MWQLVLTVVTSSKRKTAERNLGQHDPVESSAANNIRKCTALKYANVLNTQPNNRKFLYDS